MPAVSIVIEGIMRVSEKKIGRVRVFEKEGGCLRRCPKLGILYENNHLAS